MSVTDVNSTLLLDSNPTGEISVSQSELLFTSILCHVYAELKLFLFLYFDDIVVYLHSIYGDIGEYQPVSGAKPNTKKEKKPVKAGQYFQKASVDVSQHLVNLVLLENREHTLM